jgi:glycosyltransferase involved in cell wall biosynthesis
MRSQSLNSLTVVILTHNEAVHIERCIASILPITTRIFIVDSFSTDDTVPLARAMGAEVVQRKWVNYAEQFQWGLDHCGAKEGWVMRMDADEYLESSLQEELVEKLPTLPERCDGLYIRRKVFFMGKCIRHGGTYPQVLLRVWRAGRARIEQRWMDEHMVLESGGVTELLRGHVVDENLKGITFWTTKCNSYASREMVDLLNRKYPLFPRDEQIKGSVDQQAKWKRLLKDKMYARLPPGLRAVLYFFYRYIVCLGFLDGSRGFLWHALQGFWYRLLVDVKIMEIEKKCDGDIEKIKQSLRKDYGIGL